MHRCMTDLYSPEKRSQIMGRIKAKDTKPEKIVRSLLHAMGYRFRIHVGELPGKPDIVFSKKKKVIFVHGCFWHYHQECKRAKLPSTNTGFWRSKLIKNKARDELITTKLEKSGWQVLTIWQCQISDRVRLQNDLISFLNYE